MILSSSFRLSQSENIRYFDVKRRQTFFERKSIKKIYFSVFLLASLSLTSLNLVRFRSTLLTWGTAAACDCRVSVSASRSYLLAGSAGSSQDTHIISLNENATVRQSRSTEIKRINEEKLGRRLGWPKKNERKNWMKFIINTLLVFRQSLTVVCASGKAKKSMIFPLISFSQSHNVIKQKRRQWERKSWKLSYLER